MQLARLNRSRPKTRRAFLAQDAVLHTAEGGVLEVTEERGGKPLVLVLDDITDLADPGFGPYFRGAPDGQQGALHRAIMSTLPLKLLQVLHAIPR